MQTHARGQDDIWDKKFSGVTSHGLQWENKTKGLDKRNNVQKTMKMYDGNNNI